MSTRNPADPDSTDIGLVAELDETTRRAARRTVCHHAHDTADAALLLAMLGLSGGDTAPEQKPTAFDCGHCGHPMYRKEAPTTHRLGRRRHGGYGLCGRCYQSWRRGRITVAGLETAAPAGSVSQA